MISILFKAGGENSFLKRLSWAAAPAAGSSEPLAERVTLWAAFGAQLSGKYYHYSGSLTTPPCSQTVSWFVMKAPSTISADQIAAYKQLFPPPMNNRPVQPMNGRQVLDSFVTGQSLVAHVETLAAAHGRNQSAATVQQWAYEGAETWFAEHPGCGGSRQSPIDIVPGRTVSGQHVYPLPLNTSLAVTPLFDNRTHNAIRTDYIRGTMMLFGRKYSARQIHFLFPSEHSLDGVFFQAEMQITFQLGGGGGQRLPGDY